MSENEKECRKHGLGTRVFYKGDSCCPICETLGDLREVREDAIDKLGAVRDALECVLRDL